jgi:UDPglucose 6-dehydrogenase
VRAYDPVAVENARLALPESVVYCANAYEACTGADAVVIVTEWNQFRNLDLQRIKGTMRHPVFFDLRDIYDPEKAKKLGFKYFSVGRP